MARRGVAIEKWTFAKQSLVEQWLRENFGKPDSETWFVDHDYDLQSLMMSEPIYTLYLLTWQ